jgi:hypothetical protein
LLFWRHSVQSAAQKDYFSKRMLFVYSPGFYSALFILLNSTIINAIKTFNKGQSWVDQVEKNTFSA